MMRLSGWYFLLSLLLTSCITISVQTQTPAAPPFVTSTLPPTAILMAQPSFTASPAPTIAAASVSDAPKCKNAAALLADVTYPDDSNVPGGQVFTKTWRLRNTGTCPWTGFTVHFASGERMNAPDSLAVPETARGAMVDLSVDLTAPTTDGNYTTSFSLLSASGEAIPIGTERTFYAKIVVGRGSAVADGFQAPLDSLSHPPGANGIPIGSATIVCQYGYSENAGYAQELASLINRARGEAGLSALAIDPLLAQAARGHSIDMACNNFLSHESSDGSPFGAMVRAVGYPTSFQEIIAIGTPQNAMDQWAADSGHWEIVLNALATEMGVGYAYNPDSDYGGYFTVDLH